VWLNVLLFLKPFHIREIEIERQRLDVTRFHILLFQICLDRMHILRIEMPVAGGTQKHARRHIPPPKLHRLSDDEMVNAGMRGLRGKCKSERPGSDD
jgi:hypothetical protein